jgi:hypothetical protein
MVPNLLGRLQPILDREHQNENRQIRSKHLYPPFFGPIHRNREVL